MEMHFGSRVIMGCTSFSSLLIRLPLTSTLFPYTTLFRSRRSELALYDPDEPEQESPAIAGAEAAIQDRKSTRLNSSHVRISYAVFCLKKKTAGNIRNAKSLLALNDGEYATNNRPLVSPDE